MSGDLTRTRLVRGFVFGVLEQVCKYTLYGRLIGEGSFVVLQVSPNQLISSQADYKIPSVRRRPPIKH
jgi:hypothetical protein